MTEMLQSIPDTTSSNRECPVIEILEVKLYYMTDQLFIVHVLYIHVMFGLHKDVKL